MQKLHQKLCKQSQSIFWKTYPFSRKLAADDKRIIINSKAALLTGQKLIVHSFDDAATD